MKTKSFPVRSTREYDVIVAGGGTTGIAAAIAASRGGARTAAALAVRLGVAVRDVPIGELRSQLVKEGAILSVD